MSLRVRHIVCLALPRLGGMGAAALRWCEGLAERGVDVELVVPETESLMVKHPLIRPWPSYLVLGNGAVFASPRKLFDDTDIVHLHYPFFGVAEFLLMIRPPKLVVVTFHMDAEPEGWRYPFVWLQRKLLQTTLLRNATRLQVSSFDYLNHSSAANLYRENPAKWDELPFFIDETLFIPAEKARGEGIHALFVGVLDRAHAFKGIEHVLEALSLVPSVSLTIIGDGDRRAALEERVRTMRLADRVTFLGKVSQENLIRAYQQADVFLFPSTSRAEAFGLVALEAQACGTPVIASNLPGVRTVVRDGETGILIEPGSTAALVEALKRIEADPAWLERAGKLARAHVEANYRRDTLLDRQIAIYTRLCESLS